LKRNLIHDSDEGQGAADAVAPLLACGQLHVGALSTWRGSLTSLLVVEQGLGSAKHASLRTIPRTQPTLSAAFGSLNLTSTKAERWPWAMLCS
jgi:hypothetical protein